MLARRTTTRDVIGPGRPTINVKWPRIVAHDEAVRVEAREKFLVFAVPQRVTADGVIRAHANEASRRATRALLRDHVAFAVVVAREHAVGAGLPHDAIRVREALGEADVVIIPNRHQLAARVRRAEIATSPCRTDDRLFVIDDAHQRMIEVQVLIGKVVEDDELFVGIILAQKGLDRLFEQPRLADGGADATDEWQRLAQGSQWYPRAHKAQARALHVVLLLAAVRALVLTALALSTACARSPAATLRGELANSFTLLDITIDHAQFAAAFDHGDTSALLVGDANAVRTVKTPRPSPRDPQLSGDGRWLAYTRGEPAQSGVTVMDAHTFAIALDVVGAKGCCRGEAWSPDGRNYLYRRASDVGTELHRFDTVSRTDVVLPGTYVQPRAVAFAPDGDHFAVIDLARVSYRAPGGRVAHASNRAQPTRTGMVTRRSHTRVPR